MQKTSLYIHIPFCVKKCLYCDFLSAPATKNAREQYLLALNYEIEARAEEYKDREIISVFLGGGTPSILSIDELSKIFDKIKTGYNLSRDCEITIEVNPGTVSDVATFESYRKLGINRLSVGLQSTIDTELKLLGRIHTYNDFLTTFNCAREAGFDNINIDIMSALPNQSEENYELTLKRVLELNPEHISAYSLIIEPGTAFYHDYNYLLTDEKHEELDRKLYEMTERMLLSGGYRRYEISNYAKEGYECRHNKVYWQRGEYLGIGLGAASLINHSRFKNTSQFEYYIECGGMCEYEEYEKLSREDEMQEFIFLGMRLTKGICFEAFKECFGKEIRDIYGKTIDKNIADGLIELTDEGMRLTAKGLDVSNYVFAQF